MEALRYFWDTDHGILLAYEMERDFLAAYNSSIGQWVDCEYSFMQVFHDRALSEISKEDARARTSGNMPDGKYQRYLGILKSNESVLD